MVPHQEIQSHFSFSYLGFGPLSLCSVTLVSQASCPRSPKQAQPSYFFIGLENVFIHVRVITIDNITLIVIIHKTNQLPNTLRLSSLTLSMLSFARRKSLSIPEAMASTSLSSSADLNEKTLSYLALILNTIESKDWMVRVPTGLIHTLIFIDL